MRDPVIAVLGVTSPVSVDPVSHVQQFFGDDNFERPWPRSIDPRQVDQHEVRPLPCVKDVTTPDRRIHSSSQHLLERSTICRDEKPFVFELELAKILFGQRSSLFIL
jgi:hypothetical protein